MRVQIDTSLLLRDLEGHCAGLRRALAVHVAVVGYAAAAESRSDGLVGRGALRRGAGLEPEDLDQALQDLVAVGWATDLGDEVALPHYGADNPGATRATIERRRQASRDSMRRHRARGGPATPAEVQAARSKAGRASGEKRRRRALLADTTGVLEREAMLLAAVGSTEVEVVAATLRTPEELLVHLQASCSVRGRAVAWLHGDDAARAASEYLTAARNAGSIGTVAAWIVAMRRGDAEIPDQARRLLDLGWLDGWARRRDHARVTAPETVAAIIAEVAAAEGVDGKQAILAARGVDALGAALTHWYQHHFGVAPPSGRDTVRGLEELMADLGAVDAIDFIRYRIGTYCAWLDRRYQKPYPADKRLTLKGLLDRAKLEEWRQGRKVAPRLAPAPVEPTPAMQPEEEIAVIEPAGLVVEKIVLVEPEASPTVPPVEHACDGAEERPAAARVEWTRLRITAAVLQDPVVEVEYDGSVVGRGTAPEDLLHDLDEALARLGPLDAHRADYEAVMLEIRLGDDMRQGWIHGPEARDWNGLHHALRCVTAAL